MKKVLRVGSFVWLLYGALFVKMHVELGNVCFV